SGSLLLVCSIASLSFVTFAVIYRTLIIESFDAGFLRAQGVSAAAQQWFLLLVVLNLVAAFQALGTLMALGLMLLPAIAVRFWTQSIDGAVGLSILTSFAASYLGLLISYYGDVPSGPAIVLTAGTFYLLSILFGRYGSLMSRFMPRRHLPT